MSNVLEFFVKMKDLASSGLVKMASTAQNSFAKVQSHVDKVTGKNKLLSSSYDEITAKIRQTEKAISSSRIPSQIREAKNQLQELQRIQNRHTGNTSGGSSGGGGWLSQLVPALGVAGIMAMGGGALTQGLQAQSRQASFEVMAGKEQGTKLNQGLTSYAQDSIYGNEVYQNAQTMLGFGVSAKEVLPDIKMLGDVAMGDANKLGFLSLAFSQVQAAGKLTGQDLLQFINAGFNPLKEIADKTKLSFGDLKEAMSDGAISADMVKAAFQSATGPGGRFFEMTKKIAETDFGKWQAFQGQIGGFAMKVGGMLAPVLGDLVINYFTPFLDILIQSAEWIQQNSDWLSVLVGSVGSAILAYKTVVFVTELWSKAQMLLNIAMAMNPIGLVVAGIAALVIGIAIAWNKFEGFRKVVYGLWGAFKQVFSNIGEFFKQTFDPIFKAIDFFKKGEYKNAALEVAKVTYNLSPVGLAVNAVKFANDGGFSNGVVDAYKKESLRGIRKKESSRNATDTKVAS